MERDGLNSTGPPLKASYNSPFTPPFRKRNEAMYPTKVGLNLHPLYFLPRMGHKSVRTINYDVTNLQGQAIRRTITPQKIVNITLTFNNVIFSLRNNTPKPTANKTEVSRRDETTATGVDKQAHNTAT